ncbi:MAG: RusA family crossover junction endodeoxyribonuclease [Syntrophothermus sp.]
MIIFSVPGNPVGKERPRKGKSGFYTPQKTQDYEKLVKLCCIKAMKRDNTKKLDGQLEVRITAFFEPLKKLTKTKKMRDSFDMNGMYPIVTPDCDNIAKSICDALNGIAYDDDRQITDLSIIKRHSHVSGVEVSIKKCGGY